MLIRVKMWLNGRGVIFDELRRILSMLFKKMKKEGNIFKIIPAVV